MSSKKNKKAARQAAIEAEHARRQKARLEACPVDHDQFCSLLEHLARRIHAGAHESKFFALIEEWIARENLDARALLAFFESEGFADDWDVAVSANPYELFGPRDGRYARMTLEPGELDDLLGDLEDHLDEHACTGKLAFTREWLTARSKPIAVVCLELLAQGGGCDCEVVLNVEPEGLYA